MSAAEQHPDQDLSPAERRLITGAATGTLTDLRASTTTISNPARGKRWGPGRQIRAGLLAELLTGVRRPEGNLPRAIYLCSARVVGYLNLEAAAVICPLWLQDCYIEEPVSFDEATARTIRMSGCHLGGLTAAQLHTTGDLWLERITFVASSAITLDGARIGGRLVMSGTRLANPGGLALIADSLRVEQDMFCRDGFTAQGEIRLANASIGGQLDLSGAKLGNENGRALTADSLIVGKDMFCRDGFTARGEVRLAGAHIGGSLDLSGASLENQNGYALTADSLATDDGMYCRDVTASGGIGLRSARIRGQLDLDGATLAGLGGLALDLGAAEVTDLRLLPGHTPDGAVDLSDARVGQFRDDPATWPAV